MFADIFFDEEGRKIIDSQFLRAMSWVSMRKYYGGLKFVPLEFKRLVILQTIHKLKLSLSSCFTRVRFDKQEHDDKFNFTLWIDCIITNLLHPRGTSFSPP